MLTHNWSQGCPHHQHNSRHQCYASKVFETRDSRVFITYYRDPCHYSEEECDSLSSLWIGALDDGATSCLLVADGGCISDPIAGQKLKRKFITHPNVNYGGITEW